MLSIGCLGVGLIEHAAGIYVLWSQTNSEEPTVIVGTQLTEWKQCGKHVTISCRLLKSGTQYMLLARRSFK